MLSMIKRALGICVLLVSYFPLMLHAASEVDERESLVASAERAVDGYIGGLLQQMEKVKPLYETDRASYFHAVEVALSEFVDFYEVARGVMAKYGTGPNGASTEQMQRFAEVFRASLVDFYGSALASYDGVEYSILPMRELPDNPASSSNIRMNIAAEDGSNFEIQYTMFQNEEGVWKLRNLYVEGVNLRRQYYAQFDSLMSSNNYDIEKVISAWDSE